MTNHIVAIFGGAVSGSEAAWQLSRKGVTVVVFDQNTLPYGKIEDGLPKWHVKLRDQEEQKINEKLSQPSVHFVPNIRLGRDLDFKDLACNWGFSAILLAIGAWRDRPLPVEGIDRYVNKGLVYQNPFIYWFNHKHETGYQGPQIEIADGAIVVGGGLASLDVAKVLMFETVQQALLARGHDVGLFTLDRSIAKVLADLGLRLADLGLKGCTLFYRRRIKDMPLSPAPTDTPGQLARAQKVQEKILRNYQDKYLFRVKPCRMPVDMIVEGDRLAGLVFQKTTIENGRVRPVPGSEEAVRTPLVVSSVGSVPEVIDGIPMDGQVYRILSRECCRIDGFDNVFALGNAVTGRGNIRESLKHGREVATAMADQYLLDNVANISGRLPELPSPTPEQRTWIMNKVKELQQKAGYDGNFMDWVKKNLPVRLEEMIEG